MGMRIIRVLLRRKAKRWDPTQCVKVVTNRRLEGRDQPIQIHLGYLPFTFEGGIPFGQRAKLLKNLRRTWGIYFPTEEVEVDWVDAERKLEKLRVVLRQSIETTSEATVERLDGGDAAGAVTQSQRPYVKAAHAQAGSPSADGVTRRGCSEVRILFVGANPSDQAQLALTREVEEIGERMRMADYRDVYQLIQHWRVDAMALQGLLLRYRPAIVHMSGHGSRSGQLLLDSAHGGAMPLEIELAGNVFAILRHYVRCVVLSACYSRTQAEVIAKSVDVVIGIGGAIPDVDAIVFAGTFYEALGYGEDVQTAFELARNAIAINRSSSDATHRDLDGGVSTVITAPVLPELIVREGVSAAELRFVSRR